MNIKKILLLIILTFFISCKVKSQCEVYVNTINKNFENDYDSFLKKNAEEVKRGKIKLDPIDYYKNFNNCSRKSILFSFPKDSIFVMERNLEDDYAGTIVNITSIYKKDKVFIFRSTGKDLDTLNVDRDYILNNKYYNGNTYNYITQLKQGRFPQTKLSQVSKCTPLKDLTFVSLIVDKKVKKMYRICSGELIEL